MEPTVSNLVSNFPLPDIRPPQLHVLTQISVALMSGSKMIILEAPTGFGKSAVAVAVAKTYGSSFIITEAKDLQAQYKSDFNFIAQIVGRNNFSCFDLEDLPKKGMPKLTCDLGRCKSDDYYCKYKPSKEQYRNDGSSIVYENIYKFGASTKTVDRPCLYFDQKYRGLASFHTIMNYKYFLYLATYSNDELAPRKVIIFDEAHCMEDQMVDFTAKMLNQKSIGYIIPDFEFPKNLDESKRYSVQFWTGFLDKMDRELARLREYREVVAKSIQTPPQDNIQAREMRNQLSELIGEMELVSDFAKEQLANEIDDIMTRTNKMPFTKDTLGIFNESYNDQFNDLWAKVVELIKAMKERPDNWIVKEVVEMVGERGKIAAVDLRPLDISDQFKPIFEKGEVVICMSATILDKDAFCKAVGIPLNQVTFIKVPSDFPVENRLIYPINVFKLNSKAMSEPGVQEAIGSTIDNIMSLHEKDKGIIHTTSYRQSAFIKNHLSRHNKSRIIETGGGVERTDVVRRHKERTDATVLMSPSFKTGLDLKDDLSRFQVLVKVPYPDMTDRWIKAKLSKSQQWYNWQTALDLVQAYGRSVRSKTDYAVTYTIDSQFATFVSNNRHILPQWFTEAIRYSLPKQVAECRFKVAQ